MEELAAAEVAAEVAAVGPEVAVVNYYHQIN
jgi:hypothetical protein